MPQIENAIEGQPHKGRRMKRKKRLALKAVKGAFRPKDIDELTDIVLHICDILELEVNET